MLSMTLCTSLNILSMTLCTSIFPLLVLIACMYIKYTIFFFSLLKNVVGFTLDKKTKFC